MKTHPHRTMSSTIASAIVALSFLLQQVVLPWHLAAHEHLGPGEHGLGHALDADRAHHRHELAHDHEHEHEAPRRSHRHGDHEPHPAGDHVVPEHDLTLGPESSGPAPALAPSAGSPVPPRALARALLPDPESGPGPPPPRAHRVPRAPPIAV